MRALQRASRNRLAWSSPRSRRVIRRLQKTRGKRHCDVSSKFTTLPGSGAGDCAAYAVHRCFRDIFCGMPSPKYSHLDIDKTRSLVKLLGAQWNRLAAVPDRQTDSVRKVMDGDLPTSPCTDLREGQMVRITDGPLANVEGILHEHNARRGPPVVSIEVLLHSGSVEVDCGLGAPA